MASKQFIVFCLTIYTKSYPFYSAVRKLFFLSSHLYKKLLIYSAVMKLSTRNENVIKPNADIWLIIGPVQAPGPASINENAIKPNAGICPGLGPLQAHDPA